MDLVSGTVAQAMRSVALGLASAGHGVAVATTVLRGLGMPFEEAAKVASRPLPAFGAPLQAAAKPGGRRAAPAAKAGKGRVRR